MTYICGTKYDGGMLTLCHFGTIKTQEIFFFG